MSNTWKISLLALVGFVLGTSQFIVVGILDTIAASAGVSLSVAGQLVTIFSLANAIGTPLVMLATSRMDRRTLLVVALVILALGSVATLALPGFGFLMASRALLAVGTGVFYVTAMFLASTLAAPGHQARAISTITMGFSTSLILGVPFGRMVAASHDWKAIYWGIGLFCLLAIAAVARTIPATEGGSPVPLGQQLALLKQPRIAAALAVTFFLFVGYSAVNTYITPFLSALAHLSAGELNIALFAFGIATLIGSRLGGFLADRIGVPYTLVGGMAVQALALVLLSTVTGSATTTFPLLMLWGIAAWTSGPTLNHNLVSLAPEASGILLSLNSSFVQLGLAAGAVVGGVATGSPSMVAVGWTGAACVAFAASVATVSFGLSHVSSQRRRMALEASMSS
jgi:DHA1 family putative efflux transporter-like MFS transporter